MGYLLLFALACAIGFGMTSDGIPQTVIPQAWGAVGEFILFGLVLSTIKSQLEKGWTRRVAHAAPVKEVPVLKLNDTLLVDEQVRLVVSTPMVDDLAAAPAEGAGDVRRLYEALDD